MSYVEEHPFDDEKECKCHHCGTPIECHPTKIFCSKDCMKANIND